MTGPQPPSPTAGGLLSSATLACGAEVDLLLEQAADGRAGEPDSHQRDCVHCQAALAEFTATWAPVTETAGNPVPVPPGLVAAVMAQLRDVVQDVWYTLESTPVGVIRVAARVVAALARDSASTVPGVRVALGRSTHSRLAAMAERATFAHRHPHAAVGVLGRTAVVDLAIAISYGDPVYRIARNVQRQVAAALRNTIGLKTVTVNVIVDDVITGEQDDL